LIETNIKILLINNIKIISLYLCPMKKNYTIDKTYLDITKWIINKKIKFIKLKDLKRFF